MSLASSHPYRQQIHQNTPVSANDGSSTAGLLKETSVLLANRVKNQHNGDTPISSDSSGNTFHSAQTTSTKATNSTIHNEGFQDVQPPYPSNQYYQRQHKVPYIPPPPSMQSHMTPRSSNESNGVNPQQQIILNRDNNNSSSTTSLPKAPDTPVGARSFSMPNAPNLEFQTKSEENLSSRSQSPPSQGHSSTSSKRHNRMSKSVDLSHLYLLDRNESTHFTLTNESLSDVSHNLIKQYLGENSSSSLLPRMKTIEMYRKNVKKSNDPKVLFQYAQYMLQTALTIDSIDNDTNQEEAQLKKQFLKEAVHYLKKLSDKGYTDAQYLLGDAYSSGALGKVENREAFNLFQIAAKHGHVESAYRTSYCYEEGLGVSRDSRRAIEFLKFAASKNHPASMYKLGVYSFYSRMGLPDNVNVKKNGIQWLTRAVTKANELTNGAPYELGKIHENGFLDIVIPDRKYAMELYIQAASLGHVKSAAILGKAYEIGDDIIPQDSDLSIHYYTQAALGGDSESMLSLCAWYLVGNPPNLEKDEREAFQWALRAANSNLPKAQFAMGNFYEKGLGCDKDIEMAKNWYKRAAENNDERAKAKLSKIAPNLNYDQNNSKKKFMKKKSSSASIDKLAAQDSKEDKNCIIM
ncbi:unnamed protein product [Wickerhamomyces anomalus]